MLTMSLVRSKGNVLGVPLSKTFQLFERPDCLEPFRGALPGQILDPFLAGAGKNKILGRQQEGRARPGFQYGVHPFEPQASDHGADNWSLGRSFVIQGGGIDCGSQTVVVPMAA